MAYGVKYRYTVNSYIAASLLNSYRVDILKKDYSGDIIAIPTGSSEPLIFQRSPQGGSKIQPVYSSNCQLNIVADNPFDYDEFLSIAEDTFRMDVYKNSTLHWSGYVQPKITRLNLKTNSIVTVAATDGLAQLSGLDMKKSNGTSFTGRNKFSAYLKEMFLTMDTAVTKYNDGITVIPDTVTGAVTDNIYFHADAFKKNLNQDNEKVFTWFEFLEQVLQDLGGACIEHFNGEYWVTNVAAKKEAWNYYPITISDLTVGSQDSFDPRVVINFNKDQNAYITDQSLSVIADDVYKKQVVTFDYGGIVENPIDDESIFHASKISSFDDTAVAPPGTFSETTSTAMVLDGDTNATASLSFKHTVNASGTEVDWAQNADLYYQVKFVSGATTYYYDFTERGFSTAVKYVNIFVGTPDYNVEQSVSVPEIRLLTTDRGSAIAGDLTILFVRPVTTETHVTGANFDEITFTITSLINTITVSSTSESAEVRTVIPDEIKSIIGDAPSGSYAGAITLGSSNDSTVTSLWARSGITESEALRKILADTIMGTDFYDRPTWNLSGTLKGDYSINSTIRYNSEQLNGSKLCMSTGITHYVKSEIFQGEWREIGTASLVTDSENYLESEEGFLLLTENGNYLIIE